MSKGNNITKIVRLLFGVFMVIVYLAMAYLLAVNYFDWSQAPLWKTVRWGMAAILAVYGMFRGYRQITGMDYYRVTDDEDDIKHNNHDEKN